MLCLRVPVFFGCAGLISLTGLAQTPPAAFDAAAQAAERQQREEQDRQREQLRREREARGGAPEASESSAATPLPKITAPAITRRHIDKLTINGATHTRAAFIADLKQRYEGHEIGVGDLEALLTEITRHYVTRGYVTTRVYVPDQDLSKGELLLLVVEGKIERVDKSGAGALGNIFPADPGDLLNLRDLEQGIDNLNRLPSHQATLDLLPGAEPGATVIGVRDTRTKPWRLALSADNTGSEGTGKEQASATLSLDDLLGLGEGVTINHRRAVPYHAGKKASESTMASVSLPWGYQTLTLGGSASSYEMAFAAPSGIELPFTGDSRSAYARVDRVVYRGQVARVGAYANLTWKSSRNYLMNSLIGVSSRDSTVLDLGVNVSAPLAGGLGSVDGSVSRGLDWFGAAADPSGLPSFAPHAEFTVGKFTASWSRSFKLGALAASFSSSVSAQYTGDVLYGSDQQTVGGIYAVRGFDRTNLAGDCGYVWRNDLSVTLPLLRDASSAPRASLRPYVGLDQGHAWSNVSGIAGYTPPEGSLAGGAVGAALTFGRYNADVFYARSFARASGMTRENGRTYVRLNGTF